MKHVVFSFVIVGILLVSKVTYAQGEPPTARAELVNSQGQKVGHAVLTEEPDGVKISLQVSQLPAGPHAFHIHAVGQCEAPDFKSAGSHFNPYGKKHGMKNPEGPHAGDLPNLEVGPDGTGKLEVVTRGITLGEGENSLFHSGGTSIVIHAGPDDEMTDPAGNSGARIACGVVTK